MIICEDQVYHYYNSRMHLLIRSWLLTKFTCRIVFNMSCEQKIWNNTRCHSRNGLLWLWWSEYNGDACHARDAAAV